MSATIRVVPDTVRRDPAIKGLEVSDSEWRLDIGQYQDFIEATTGLSPSDGLSASDCYRIGNRLQAFVEERKRRNDWDATLVEAYPDVQSLKEFVWLARFFRACHDCHDAGEVCLSQR